MAYYQQSVGNYDWGHPIYLYTTPLASQKKFMKKKPIDLVGHWAICIQGYFYELTKNPNAQTKRDPKHIIRTLPYEQWQALKGEEERVVQPPGGPAGYTARPWTPSQIKYMADQIWRGPLQSKYVYDENNCQVFTRLLVDMLGNEQTKVDFPTQFDKVVKAVGNTRDGAALAVTAGMITVAAGASLVMVPVDGGATAAVGFALAAQTALRSTTALLAVRHSKEKAMWKSQEELKRRLRQEGYLPMK
ncbi:hypothetical protein BKA67DRAFT_670665 [Truncatella angustata]|uniref:Uncharacterized protein n=1 Tax=Truncatella angustata TaxID=152316 RepID=A0A9P8UAR8_9PEZI|nr:uncharacterized protein BKA67DRAFT_670665 [Truncatella angustata]KAH6645122.1 hypothetical protein BKA67DRAFT_670665 [Truncatella angustata]